MCGIFCIIEHNGSACQSREHFWNIERLLYRRGPDFQMKHAFSVSSTTTVRVMGTTLHLRGVLPVIQPVLAEGGNFLIWNGEIFNGIEISEHENDTMVLFELLQQCSNSEEVVSLMAKIHGPFAFIYWQESQQKLWFGRDFFGRRSLLWKYCDSPVQTFVLSSVADRPLTLSSAVYNSHQEWSETPGNGIYYVDLSCKAHNFAEMLHLFSWHDLSEPVAVIPTIVPIRTRPILEMKIEIAEINVNLPTEEDLKIFSEVNHLTETQTTNPVCANLEYIFGSMLDVNGFQNALDEFEMVLRSAVKKRVENRPCKCQKCVQQVIHSKNEQSLKSDIHCHHSKIAILFSGGLDSTILAALVDRCLPAEEPIDLLNVAFEQNVKHLRSTTLYDVPDRISGKEAFKELQLLTSTRQWNFVEINVSKDELQKHSVDHISDLIYPLVTVLDNDIGCALWFAARGCGVIYQGCEYNKYTSTARVVLTGMGADEQLAGYSRHRVCFLRGGWQVLLEELKMEMRRISSRNLGRDDRVISDHGREARFPFLDEAVVAYLNQLPIWYKANLSLPRGIGDKFLLRMLAYKMGLRKPATLVKRAIQFGSRIAKMENNHKGSDICGKLMVK